MADFTDRLPLLQPQMFNALPPGALRPNQPDPNAAPSYGDQMGNVGRFLMNAVGAGANFLFNAPGGGGLLDAKRLMADTPVLPAMSAPAPTAAAKTAAMPATPEAPAAAALPAPVRAAATGAPKAAGAGTSASMPAGAPAPLVPGETGFFMNDTLVPYGTRFLASGDGTTRQISGPGGAPGSPMDGLPGGGKMVNGKFVDPRDALEYGFRLQSQYRDESMAQILRLAGDGGALGFRAKIGALANAFGGNNFGATSVGGANSLNSAIASITSSEMSSDATRYSADQHLKGVRENVASQNQYHMTDSVPMGTSLQVDPVTKMAVPTTVYGQRPTKAGAMPMPYDNKPAAPKPTEGATGTLPDGRRFVIKDGEPVITK